MSSGFCLKIIRLEWWVSWFLIWMDWRENWSRRSMRIIFCWFNFTIFSIIIGITICCTRGCRRFYGARIVGVCFLVLVFYFRRSLTFFWIGRFCLIWVFLCWGVIFDKFRSSSIFFYTRRRSFRRGWICRREWTREKFRERTRMILIAFFILEWRFRVCRVSCL